MKTTRLAGLASLTLAAALAVSACGSPAATTPPADGGTTAPTVSGDVTVYAAHGPEVTDPVVELFKKTYPDVNVTVVAMPGTGEMMSRIEAEISNPLGDLAWGGSTELYAAAAEGAFASVELPNDAAVIAQDPNHKWHATDVLFQAMAVNTDRVTEADYPTTLTDFQDPKWKGLGKIAFANPRSSGTTYSVLASMVTAHGWEFLDTFLPNAAVVDGSSAMFDGIRTGEYAAGWINEDLGNAWMQEGAPLKLIYPTDGVSNQIGAAAIIEGAKNAEPAKVFVDFLMSPEAQTAIVELVGRRSARNDVPAPEGLVPAADLNLVEPDPAVFAKDKEGVLTKWDEKLAAFN